METNNKISASLFGSALKSILILQKKVIKIITKTHHLISISNFLIIRNWFQRNSLLTFELGTRRLLTSLKPVFTPLQNKVSPHKSPFNDSLRANQENSSVYFAASLKSFPFNSVFEWLVPLLTIRDRNKLGDFNE